MFWIAMLNPETKNVVFKSKPQNNRKKHRKIVVGWLFWFLGSIFWMSNNNGTLFMLPKDGRFYNVSTRWRML